MILKSLLARVMVDAKEKKIVGWVPQPDFEAIFMAAGLLGKV